MKKIRLSVIWYISIAFIYEAFRPYILHSMDFAQKGRQWPEKYSPSENNSHYFTLKGYDKR